MKKVVKQIILVAFLSAAGLFYACDREFEEPAVDQITAGVDYDELITKLEAFIAEQGAVQTKAGTDANEYLAGIIKAGAKGAFAGAEYEFEGKYVTATTFSLAEFVAYYYKYVAVSESTPTPTLVPGSPLLTDTLKYNPVDNVSIYFAGSFLLTSRHNSAIRSIISENPDLNNGATVFSPLLEEIYDNIGVIRVTVSDIRDYVAENEELAAIINTVACEYAPGVLASDIVVQAYPKFSNYFVIIGIYCDGYVVAEDRTEYTRVFKELLEATPFSANELSRLYTAFSVAQYSFSNLWEERTIDDDDINLWLPPWRVVDPPDFGGGIDP